MIVVGRSDRAKKVYKEVVRWATQELIDDEDIIVVVGGDGFLLGSANKHGLDKTYIPINGGHMGFLLNDAYADGMIDCDPGEDIRDQNWMVREFPTLVAHFDDGTSDFAINDVYIERSSGQTARVSIKVDGSCLVSKMVCDGAIVSTPLGSTGYNLSAGGPVVHPLNKNIIVIPNNAHYPTFKPVVLPSTSKVLLTAEDTEFRPVRIVTDGRTHENVTRVNIGFGKEKLRLGYFNGHNFTRRLVKKILNRRGG